MRRGDKDVKQKVIQIFKTNLLLGQNFHYEVSNRHIDMALSEILSYFNTEKNNLRRDYQAGSLLFSLKQVMDFKLLNNMLDFKTYIQLLQLDLQTCDEFDPLKVFDHSYAPFLEKHLETRPLNFRELDVIQQAIMKDRDAFPDCNKTY
jgi:hypothetical protein